MAEIRLTTWDVWNPINNGKNYEPQLKIAGFQPSTVPVLSTSPGYCDTLRCLSAPPVAPAVPKRGRSCRQNWRFFQGKRGNLVGSEGESPPLKTRCGDSILVLVKNSTTANTKYLAACLGTVPLIHTRLPRIVMLFFTMTILMTISI